MQSIIDLKKTPEFMVYSEKRLINPRYQFIVALVMLFSILVGALIESKYIWIPITVCCVCAILTAVIFRRKIVFIVLLFLFSIGMLFYSVALSNPEISAVSQEAELYTAVAAEDSKYTESGLTVVILKNVTSVETGNKLSHKMQLYVTETEFCKLYCGDRIVFQAAVHEIERPQNPGEANWRLMSLAKGVAFSAYANIEDIDIVDHETNFSVYSWI